MIMSKKLFIALADTLWVVRPTRKATPGSWNEIYEDARIEQWEVDMNTLGDFLTANVPMFNRTRWIGYIAGKCGPSGGKQ